MGLPVNRTKVHVYILSGFCSALAGILYSIYVESGHGTHGTGFELTTIAAVVIGGIALTGGEGYLLGALFGVLITSLIQSLIQFNGQLAATGLHRHRRRSCCVFIGVQSLVAAWNSAAHGRAVGGTFEQGATLSGTGARPGANVYSVVAVVTVASSRERAMSSYRSSSRKRGHGRVQLKADADRPGQDPDRRAARSSSTSATAAACVDELYAIYADGRIDRGFRRGHVKQRKCTGGAGRRRSSQDINDYRLVQRQLPTTSHTPCGPATSTPLTVKYNGQTKTVDAVDGGIDASGWYWLITAELSGLLPERGPQ